MICTNKGSNFANAKKKKEYKYTPLVVNLEASLVANHLFTLEIGFLGHYTKDAIQSLQLMIPSIIRKELSMFLKSLAKTAI